VTSPSSSPPPEEFSFALHYLPVMRLCLSRLGDTADAEDATQEVFRRAVQHAAELRRHTDSLPWLLTVAKNVCHDELRRRTSGRAVLERSATLAPPAQDGPERDVLGRLYVDELLDRLTPAERRVMATRLATGEVDSLGATSTTRVLLARARQKLRRYIEEGQSALGVAWVFGTRFVHSARRRMLERTWGTGQGRASSLLIPAALIITVVIGPGRSGAGVGDDVGAAPSGIAALAPQFRDGEGADARAAGQRVQAGSMAEQYSAVSASSRHAPPPTPAQPSSPLAMLQPDPEAINTADIEPSPNYSSDHTVLMMGTPGNCSPPPCTHLFKSTDGGSTWTYVSAEDLGFGSSIIIPASSVHAERFYTKSIVGGLQMTTNGGESFVPVVPALAGSVTAPPAWTGLDAVVSNSALWKLTNDVRPTLISPFDARDNMVGNPLVIPNAIGGYEVLQPVNPAHVGGTPATAIVHCNPMCGTRTLLPFWANAVKLVPSPNLAADHTIYAVGPDVEIAVSRDDGRTFTSVAPTQATEVVAVAEPSGRRLVAILNGAPFGSLAFSDDGGLSWHSSSLSTPSWFGAHTLRVLRPGRLIVSMTRSGVYRFDFACSADGSAWAACTPDDAT
jgi:RNA polymerase sigma-70 factor, ECF subfamily